MSAMVSILEYINTYSKTKAYFALMSPNVKSLFNQHDADEIFQGGWLARRMIFWYDRVLLQAKLIWLFMNYPRCSELKSPLSHLLIDLYGPMPAGLT